MKETLYLNNVKVILFLCYLYFQASTTESIIMKFDIYSFYGI